MAPLSPSQPRHRYSFALPQSETDSSNILSRKYHGGFLSETNLELETAVSLMVWLMTLSRGEIVISLVTGGH